jgi:hypothetical protein
MEKWLLLLNFCHVLVTSTHELVDAIAGGAFLSLKLDEDTTLIEKMALN